GASRPGWTTGRSTVGIGGDCALLALLSSERNGQCRTGVVAPRRSFCILFNGIRSHEFASGVSDRELLRWKSVLASKGRCLCCYPESPFLTIHSCAGHYAGDTQQRNLCTMSDKVYNTLFLCTGNSARSIMAEVLLNNFGRERFRAYSAGSRPGTQMSPLTIEVLQSARLPVEGLRSKSWDEFAKPTAPQLDFVITLCDSAAGEECPLWPGQPITAHWGFEDPSAFEGTAEAKRTYFDKIF